MTKQYVRMTTSSSWVRVQFEHDEAPDPGDSWRLITVLEETKVDSDGNQVKCLVKYWERQRLR